MFEAVIGKRSKKILNIVERGAVKKFAEAVGDPHPLYFDIEFGKKSRYAANITPPTFPQVFDYGTVEGLRLPEAGLIHGEQSFVYRRPLRVGEAVYGYTVVESYVEKPARSGKLGFLTLKRVGEDAQGEEVFHSRSVIILTEAVRRRMADA